MNVGDLLDRPVVGPDGARLGVAVDVRLALEVREPEDGQGTGSDQEHEDSEHRDPDPPLSAAARRDAVGSAVVVGLLVSPHAGGSFLGYERTGVRSPWPVAQLVLRRHRGTFLVRWEDVAAARDGEIRLAEGFARHDPGLG